MCSVLTQIIYDDTQRQFCYPFAEIYFNKDLTIFFENTCIIDVVTKSEAEKISVTSWKLKEKMKWYIGRPREITQELLNSDYEVMSFTKNTKHHYMLAAADRWHSGFKDTMKKILHSCGINMPNEVKIPIYQNHFSASRGIYKDYIKNYLVPVMNVMQNDVEINKLVMADSKYSELDKSSKEKMDNIERKLGIRYYPLAPFLLERLFSIYVHNNRLMVTHL